jgi:ribosome modulation factor
MSSLYQAESLGYDAYMDMKGKGENPYPNNTEEHEAWENGWNAAYDEDGLEDDYDEWGDDDFYGDDDDDDY